jgi:mRNA-degrading endonuclease RelE of RelBE toxin-antitoxin system
MKHHYELTTRAVRDLRKIDGHERKKLVANIERLIEIPQPKNLDVETITGHEPFCRLRVGDWRIIYRQLTEREMAILLMRRGTLGSTTGFMIERLVDRKYLERAVAALELVELS